MAHTAKANVERWRGMVADVSGPMEVWYMLGLMDRLSSGNPDFEGRLGGIGLFQIGPNTARILEIDPEALWTPEFNASVAVQLLASRAQEINEKDPQMVVDRPADLTLLTTASYLWGPGTILPALQPGDTAAEVFSRLDPQIGEFAVDVLRRGAAYQEQPNGDMVPTNGEEPPAEMPSIWSALAWIGGISLVGVGLWFAFRKSDDE